MSMDKKLFKGIIIMATAMSMVAVFPVFGQKIQSIDDLGTPETTAQVSQPAPAKQRPLTIEERITKLERASEKNQSLVEMMRRLEVMEAEMQRLRGDVEVLSHNIEGMNQRQKDLYLDIDRRLKQFEGGGGRSSLPPGSSSSLDQGQDNAASSTAAAPADPALAGQERQAYEQAFTTLKDGRYEQAIQEFNQFLVSYPSGQYAPNALYWLGEANYVNRRYKTAVTEFKKFIERYPDNGKMPDALLKLGFSYYELSEWGKAREALTDVTKRYANSTAARLASGRLEKMANEGH